ncbi:RNA polymerase sigma-70 factor (ECF subfamily) [Actinoalloteichus hoggarensis]|uniref:ECF RNA polymerase sigma factor SigJ n=1 Tax=Actinoalloteichus hoggarensis TaxID=1470176 RepID=A0A221W542_9PSEU|nr:sigma-70 family RNA polymerase sigma factor [Actinoalloteichus hoggarensis]ASO20776.1 ECF RNA polymerase sigma factor SigJ [Actinoalloteichus hoggarensis]MBB5920706.1 RNA polymerase sigma-70 factor (ECF subfamily) [Actinoalloteichus hoggarensis]
MNERDTAARLFEAHRSQLRAVAYRMLGSTTEAEDAVQETWVRFDRADTAAVDNLGGWLTRVVARVSLDMLRSRRARRERPVGWPPAEAGGPAEDDPGAADPEHEAVLADSVSRALLVVLETLTPGERIAFVLHDGFAVSFAEIGALLDRSPDAAKKLAQRARRKVRGDRRPDVGSADLARHRRVVDAFVAAVRGGDLNGLLTVLHPDVVRRVDGVGLPAGVPAVVRGAREVIAEARLFAGRAARARPVLVDGAPGAVVTGGDGLELALTFLIDGDLITEFHVITDPDRLRRLRLGD